jgi:soluble lytic murein transglycosylase-like protein
MSTTEVIYAVREAAKQFEIDEDLAVAIAMQESSCMWPIRSCRFEPGWSYFFNAQSYADQQGITLGTEMMLQACSWGPMHVMGSVARELGFVNPLPLLFNMREGAYYGCKKLSLLAKKYEKEESVISAYNAGSITLTLDKKYRNQEYVDSVMLRLLRLRSINGG